MTINYNIARRHSIPVKIGSLIIGSDAPITIQSMTNTNTNDVLGTVNQIQELVNAGAELVRITINNKDAATAVPWIVDHLIQRNIHVPIVGDFHFNGHSLLTEYPDCAVMLDKYRINPGNVGKGQKKDKQFATIIELACRYDKPIRIGVNSGSLNKALMSNWAKNSRDHTVICEAMVESALNSATFAEEIGIGHNRIVLSAKMSSIQGSITVYRKLASYCDYPLHIGLTESGLGTRGIIASTVVLAVLLQDGIGDTLRVSITPISGSKRETEIRIAQDVLQTMGLRSFVPQVISCPGCGRTSSDYFQKLAGDIKQYLDEKMPSWRKLYPGVEAMTVAVMGCVVNGPGESKQADIGISLPGTADELAAPVYIGGVKIVTLRGADIITDFKNILENYVASHYSIQ